MKSLLILLFLVASCSTLNPDGSVKPGPTNPRVPKIPPVTIGSCFISSVSDAVYKVIRCNITYCLVKNSL
ncbi:MAG: hypothetical protein AABY22_03340, partial [Nanoarchaeota archaeon]